MFVKVVFLFSTLYFHIPYNYCFSGKHIFRDQSIGKETFLWTWVSSELVIISHALSSSELVIVSMLVCSVANEHTHASIYMLVAFATEQQIQS